MLVLTRKKSQLIQIGDNIVIKVIRTGPGSVKIGIDAPSHVRVMRGELDEKLTQTYQDQEELLSALSRVTGKISLEGEKNSFSSEAGEADCRRVELAEEEEPVSYVSRKRTRGCVA